MSTRGRNNGIRFRSRSNSGGGLPRSAPKMLGSHQSEYVPTTGLGTIPSARGVEFSQRKSNKKRPPPQMNKLISAPIHPRFNANPNIASYEYMSESEDSFKEDHALRDDPQSSELQQIQTKLKQWIGNDEFVILDQFIELMLKIAPGVSADKATEIFNQIDQWNDGQIESKVLIHNNFLPEMILRLFNGHGDSSDGYASSHLSGMEEIRESQSQSELEEDNYAAQYKHMNLKQLRKETARLQQWIVTCGQPAVSKATELQAMVNIYEAERESQHEKVRNVSQMKQQLEEQLSATQKELSHQMSTSKFLNVQQHEVITNVEESENRWQTQQKQLEAKDKELRRYKRLVKDMQKLNEKYLHKNEQLTQDKEELLENVSYLSEMVLQYESEIEQWRQNREVVVKEMQAEMQEIKLDLESKTVQAQELLEQQQEAGADDIMAIAGNDQNKTITILRQESGMPTMANEMDMNSIDDCASLHSRDSKHSVLHKWYTLHSGVSSNNLSNHGFNTRGSGKPLGLRNVMEDRDSENSRGFDSDLDENDHGPYLDEQEKPMIFDHDDDDHVMQLLRMGASITLRRTGTSFYNNDSSSLSNQRTRSDSSAFQDVPGIPVSWNHQESTHLFQSVSGGVLALNEQSPNANAFESVKGTATTMNQGNDTRDSFEAVTGDGVLDLNKRDSFETVKEKPTAFNDEGKESNPFEAVAGDNVLELNKRDSFEAVTAKPSTLNDDKESNPFEDVPGLVLLDENQRDSFEAVRVEPTTLNDDGKEENPFEAVTNDNVLELNQRDSFEAVVAEPTTLNDDGKESNPFEAVTGDNVLELNKRDSFEAVALKPTTLNDDAKESIPFEAVSGDNVLELNKRDSFQTVNHEPLSLNDDGPEKDPFEDVRANATDGIMNAENVEKAEMVQVTGNMMELNQREQFQSEKVGHAQLQQSHGPFVDVNENVAELNQREAFKDVKGLTLGQLNDNERDRSLLTLHLEEKKGTTETINMRDRKQSFQDVRGPIHGTERILADLPQSTDQVPQSCRSTKSNPFEEMRKKCALRGHRHSMSLTQMEIMHGLKESAEFVFLDSDRERSPSKTPSHQLFETVMQKASSLNDHGGRRRSGVGLRRTMTLSQVDLPPHSTVMGHSQSMAVGRRRSPSKTSSSFNHGYSPHAAGIIFEEAVTREAKAELTEQIKEELQEDFELKLHQKEIEMQLRLGEQKEEYDAKEKELIQKYETLIQEYEAKLEEAMNESRRNSYHSERLVMIEDPDEDTKTSEVEAGGRKTFLVRGDELDPDDTTIPLITKDQFVQRLDDLEEMKAQIKADPGFYDRVARLFADSTLLWALPMTK